MKMRSICLFFVIACILLQIGFSQENNVVPSTTGIPKNQTVKIDFERLDKEKGTIWLRLHNWTAWPIRIPVELSSQGIISRRILMEAKNHKDGAPVEVRYYLEEYDPGPMMQITTKSGKKVPPDEPEHPPVPKIHRVDFLTEWWIPKGERISFEIPKEHLARNIALYVDLRYEWENLGTETLDGPVHRVYIRGIDLPPNVQKLIK